ncbi:MAG: hypothetical protein FWG31_07505 [Oscillospiraceae bacterium]|nr:hypothetical protein [Oscillospiraceae bacterium]
MKKSELQRALGSPEPDEQLKDRLKAKLAAKERAPFEWKRWTGIAVAACMLIALIAVPMWVMSGNSGDGQSAWMVGGGGNDQGEDEQGGIVPAFSVPPLPSDDICLELPSPLEDYIPSPSPDAPDMPDTPSPSPNEPVEDLPPDVAKGSGDFYYGYFDLNFNSGRLIDIPSFIIRVHGHANTIDINDLTDIVLTRDGVPVANGLSYSGVFNQTVWYSPNDTWIWGWEVTDFYFSFNSPNTTPGEYWLTGKYKGIPLFSDNSNTVVEEALGNNPADPSDLQGAGCGGMGRDGGGLREISSFSLYFNGIHDTLSITDITDLRVYLDGIEITVPLLSLVTRYRYSDRTGFAIEFSSILDKPGQYTITGKYRGASFEVTEEILP